MPPVQKRPQVSRQIISLIKSHILVVLILVFWQMCVSLEVIPDYLLPSPLQIVEAFIEDFPLLMEHAKYTLATAFIGTAIGLIISFVLSILMDLSKTMKELIYPVILLNQTIPTIAIAPLLIIWLGYGITPKVVLVVLAVFFPITIALVDGYQSLSREHLNLFKSMKASKYQLYRHLKIPSAMGSFFTGLKVALSYALISAVIAEWLGGYHGLRKSYDLDSMFAVIFLISFLTILLIGLVKWLERRVLRHNYL